MTSFNRSAIGAQGPVDGERAPANSSQLTITRASRRIQKTVSAMQSSRMTGFGRAIIGREG